MRRFPLRPLLWLSLALGLTVSAAWGAGPAALPGSYAELADLRSASRAKPWRTLQASGYDRGGGFYDSGNFLREEPGRRYVMLDRQGPGCIDRMWFTRKSTTEPWELQLFLDGAREPSIRIDLDELCSGQREPFRAPFVGMVNLARYCYVPIGFTRGCKAVLVPTAPPERYSYRENSAGQKIPHIYYQLTYRSLPEGHALRPFRPHLELAERQARDHVVALWTKAGHSPWPLPPPGPLNRGTVVIPGGASVEVSRREGEAVLGQIALRVPADAPTQKLRLEIRWDGSPQPAVSAPLGSFFAAPDPKVDARGLWLGREQGWYHCYLPMPFRKGMSLRLVSQHDRDVTIDYALEFLAGGPQPDDLYLHARAYDHQPPLAKEDYTVFQAEGRGHWVGLVMDRPGNMEGDDRFFVDGEPMPSIHGTGTEDFFSFAWGFSHLANLPLHGITRNFGAPVLYRLHLPAAVPFRRSLKLTFEHGHGNEHQGRYSGVAFAYLEHP